MLNRSQLQHRFIDPLTASLRIPKYALQELQLVERRARVNGRARIDEVLDLRATKRRHTQGAQRLPHLRLVLVELNASRAEPTRCFEARNESIDLLPERRRNDLLDVATDPSKLELKLQ